MNLKGQLRKAFKDTRGFTNTYLVAGILGLFGVGIVAAVYVIFLGEMYSSTTNNDALTVINNTLDLFTNFTGQFDTIGTIGGVLLLLVLLAAAGIGVYAGVRAIKR